MTLPDATQLKDDHIDMLDGTSYVVEINQNRVYRTYCYDNPDSHHRPQDQQMVKLMKVIGREFGLDEKRRKLYRHTGKP